MANQHTLKLKTDVKANLVAAQMALREAKLAARALQNTEDIQNQDDTWGNKLNRLANIEQDTINLDNEIKDPNEIY